MSEETALSVLLSGTMLSGRKIAHAQIDHIDFVISCVRKVVSQNGLKHTSELYVMAYPQQNQIMDEE